MQFVSRSPLKSIWTVNKGPGDRNHSRDWFETKIPEWADSVWGTRMAPRTGLQDVQKHVSLSNMAAVSFFQRARKLFFLFFFCFFSALAAAATLAPWLHKFSHSSCFYHLWVPFCLSLPLSCCHQKSRAKIQIETNHLIEL